MDFDNRKVYGDTSITDGLVALVPEKQLEEQCEEVDGDDDQPGKLKEYENQKLRL